jgi:ParB family transcriptional regulator, chromosome partitioning protein
MPCEAAKPAIVVNGKQLGRKLTVCTDKHCPIHDPQAAAEAAAHPVPTMPPAPETETEQEAAARQEEFERQRAEYEEERQRREEERRQEFEQEQAEYEAESNRKAEILKAREATFHRIFENAPATFSAAQLRAFLRALVNLDPYQFIEDLAQEIVGDNDNETRSAEQVLLSTIDGLEDDKLTGFALRLALTAHVAIPREGEIDYLAEAEQAFTPPEPKSESKEATKKGAKPASKKLPKKVAAKKQIAA